jgi:hypothetical protein
MLKQIECKIVESRPLEPCRSISHRQSDNCRQDRFARPPRPDFRDKNEPAPKTGFFSMNPDKPLAFRNTYPVGMIVDILA